MENQAQPVSPGKIVWWAFLALFTLLMIWQFFEIQDKCAYYEATDAWQKAACF